MKYKIIKIKPVSGALGAEISGVDLSKPLTKKALEEIKSAWLEHQVLFFRNQSLTPEQHVAFTKNFGELQGPGYMPTLDGYPNVYVQEYPGLYDGIVSDVTWHIDASFMEKPLKGAVLYALDVPDVGGDTAWVNLYAAYELLSKPMQELCSSLTAIHDNFHKNLTLFWKPMVRKAMKWLEKQRLLVNTPWFANTQKQERNACSTVNF